MRKYVVSSFITLFVAFNCMVLSATATSIPFFHFNHQYDGKSDICTVCGYPNVHECKPVLLFVTYQDGVVARPNPRNDGMVTRTYEKAGTRLYVNGRVRNEKGNLWLRLTDGSFIFVDRTAFDFDATAQQAIDRVRGYNPIDPKFYAEMLYCFGKDGEYDLKRDNHLGLNTNYYYFYSHGIIQSRTATGEMLGNYLYGYVCNRIGMTYAEATYYSGVAANKISDKFQCLIKGDLTRCDDEDDRKSVSRPVRKPSRSVLKVVDSAN